MSWRGFCHPPNSASKLDAELTLLPQQQLRLCCDAGSWDWPISRVDMTPSLGRLPLTLTFPDGHQFIPQDSQALAAALKGARRGNRLHWWERHWLAIGGSVLAVALLMVLMFSHGLPGLSRVLVHLLPEAVAAHVGEQTLAALDEHLLQPTALSEARQQELHQQFVTLVAQVPPTPVVPRLQLRRWEAGPNALALSDGTIVVMDSLVTLADTPAQLNSILLHELGHLEYQHVMTSLVRSALISTAVALMTGESTGLADNFLGGGVFILTQGYSRADEAEADTYALAQMQRVYGSVTPMQQMFERLEAATAWKDGPEWLSTHPGMQHRLDAIAAAAEAQSR
ncbi:M48 family metallopeptidase [Photobacterium sp. TY1-4]|uniref:M48 family metallopeptidase n=1 Tax=Photobacterium sp. TY1-4 TaxID=2899122 RepID=UPI0021BF3FEB|nr:M48 family metallopeptidase [Photobacterium sp. TY1-4]UXI00939.1 M48 family metallopeptidase [Photobacterium sp. TY1-4]